jgi:tRNA threonylcarbamoyladenosine modification (KEOPS) complex  Pcc1 subunit
MKDEARYEAVVTMRKTGKINYTKLIGKLTTYKRSSIALAETPAAFTVKITASDPAALKSSLNSVIKDIQVIESVRKVKIPQTR